MARQSMSDRITFDAGVLGGKATIRGLRISVEQILRARAAGVSEQDLLEDYPELEPEDLRAVDAYAADRIAEERVFPVGRDRTAADLSGVDTIGVAQVAEASQYRTLDRQL